MSSNPKDKNPQDDDEIDLDSDSDNDENENENNENKNIEVSNNDNKSNEKQEEEINQKEDISPNEPAAAASTSSTTTTATATATTTKKATSKKSKLQERLRKLQLKINQSKKLNHQQVREEGERLCSKEAIRKHKNQTFKNDLKAKKQEEWDNVHEKNVSNLLKNNDDSKNSSGNGSASASASGSNSGKFVNKSKKEIKALTESGSESLRHAFKKTEKVERNRYSTTDCYNPEGQLRNYERSLESIPGSSAGGSRSSGIRVAAPVADSYNHDTNTERQFMNERNGAKRLADELKRREKKSEKRKQKQMDFEAADVSYINKRNKHFNEKINRNYDKHTAEIRQNLERGTAL